MTDYVDYWDSEAGEQKLRACTPAEQAEIDSRRAAAAVPLVPPSVSRKAARLALAHEGLFHLVQPAIDALPEPQRTLAQIEWDDSLTFERSNPIVISIGALIGLDSELLDALFASAGLLE